MDDVFLNNQQVQQFHEKATNNSSSSSVAMKFKSNNVYSGPRGVVSANSPYARAMPVHNSNKISHVPSALASVASLEDLQGGPSKPEVNNQLTTTGSTRPPSLPGENLPEHHFKKRYFKTELSNRGSQDSSSTTPTSNISSVATSKNRNGSPNSNSLASPTTNRE